MEAIEESIRSLYRTRFDADPASVEALRADGSNRRIWRLGDDGGATVIAVHGPDPFENRAFLSFTDTFRSLGLPVPEILASDMARGIYLEEDLGDTTLLAAIVAARTGDEFPEEVLPIYDRVLEQLVRFQVDGGAAIDFSAAYPVAEFDRRGIMWDLNYFKYDFLKLAAIPFHETRLEADFERLSAFLLGAERRYFLYRDFQPRNIMVRDGEPWFIDYQGGRRGALQYDLASLLYSSKSAMPSTVRERLVDRYLAALEPRVRVDRDAFIEQYRGFVLVRILQLLGAYGFRGYFERKAHFLESVPHAIANIEELLAAGPLPVDLPELRDVLARLSEPGALPQSRDDASAAHVAVAGEPDVPRAPLTVTVRSFSYKQGYPEESTAHGGGFVFDCRALHNPGRYEEFKPLCGLDAAVIEFLEREEAVETFFGAVWTMVSGAVAAYLERGFEHLSVGFGCTGGQHRSVYFAERLARTLRSRFPEISVEVLHRESQRWPRASDATTAESRSNSSATT
jgi:aminoglycoside/choline kinase family phosphotransferase